MKRLLSTMAIVTAILMLASASFAGNIGGTVTVQATIVGQCKTIGLNNIAQTSDFGSILVDETTGPATNTLTATSVKCSTGLPYTISYALSGNASGAQRRMKYTDLSATDHFLDYSFTPTTIAGSYTGAGFGAAAVSIGGTVDLAGAALQGAFTDDSTAGVQYTDTIVVDLAF